MKDSTSSQPRTAARKGRIAKKLQRSRTALTRDFVVAAALEEIDRHGLNGFSLRNVAKQLGVYPTAISWHVTNRNVLGHTYQAHPVACAAGLEVQRIIGEENLLANVCAMGTLLELRLRERFEKHEHIGDIRGGGLFFALEFLEDRGKKTPFDPALQVHARIKEHALRAGLAIYPTGGTIDGTKGDHLIVASPYICQPQHIETIVERLALAVAGTLRELRCAI